jgi:hypothetical protein
LFQNKHLVGAPTQPDLCRRLYRGDELVPGRVATAVTGGDERA